MASRSNHHLPPALVVALCAGLLGCGGSSEHLTPPSLANFSYGPSSAALNQGAGSVTVSWIADLTDPGADITQEVVTVKSAAGATLATFTFAIQNPAGVTSGSFTGDITFPTAVAASYRFTIQVFDSLGTGSNVLEGTFTVN